MTASTATAVRPVAIKEQRVPRLRQASMRLGGMLAGRLAARGLNVLFQVRLSRKRLRVPVSPGVFGYPLLRACNGWNVTNRHE
jgi:hypothetical protein